MTHRVVSKPYEQLLTPSTNKAAFYNNNKRFVPSFFYPILKEEGKDLRNIIDIEPDHVE